MGGTEGEREGRSCERFEMRLGSTTMLRASRTQSRSVSIRDKSESNVTRCIAHLKRGERRAWGEGGEPTEGGLWDFDRPGAGERKEKGEWCQPASSLKGWAALSGTS